MTVPANSEFRDVSMVRAVFVPTAPPVPILNLSESELSTPAYQSEAP